jgi:hypothetical protein
LSTTPFPQTTPQSVSLIAVQPAPVGQHPSPDWHTEIVVRSQVKLHADADRPGVYRVQLSAGGHSVSHDVGTVAGSQVSQGDSTTPLPQTDGQSESKLAFAPEGQHPSPFRFAVVVTNWQRAVQLPSSIRMSSVHGTPSEQLLGQLPVPVAMAASQVSPGSTLPFPQVAGQSGSDAEPHPVGQHPSGTAEQPASACI